MSVLKIARTMGIPMIGTIVVDQASKELIRTALPLCAGGPSGACARIPIVGPVDLMNTSNPGTAFGLLGGAWLPVVLVVALAIIASQARVARPDARIVAAVGLQVGGLIGNLVDRLLFGGVTDFIHIGVADRGIFLNPADIALVVGGAIVGARVWRRIPGWTSGADHEVCEPGPASRQAS